MQKIEDPKHIEEAWVVFSDFEAFVFHSKVAANKMISLERTAEKEDRLYCKREGCLEQFVESKMSDPIKFVRADLNG